MAIKKEEYRDMGIGTSANTRQRILNPDGTFNVIRKGLPWFAPYNFYSFLITASWRKFVFLVVSSYLLLNLLFAGVYLFIGIDQLAGVIKGEGGDDFLEAFFFSAQTITTVGYGRISPVGHMASIVAAIESMTGLMAFALATGLLYGRFSRPDAKLIFSKNALIAPYKDGKGIMFRLANKRNNQLVDVEAQVTLLINETVNGKVVRGFYPLTLERTRINFLSLSWTVVHPIDEESPFYNLDKAKVDTAEAEFIVLIKAFDDTFSQNVHTRTSYRHDELVWDARFTPVFYNDNEGFQTLDLSKINAHEGVK